MATNGPTNKRVHTLDTRLRVWLLLGLYGLTLDRLRSFRMDRALIVKMWNEAWESGLWAAAWSKSVDGLTAAQATWQPGPGRHSIWQIVEHLIFWRGVVLKRAAGGDGPTEAEVAAGNFPQPTIASEAAWADLCQRFAASQRAVAMGIESGSDLDRFPYLTAHDAYHMGQINYLRAMQGLPAVE